MLTSGPPNQRDTECRPWFWETFRLASAPPGSAVRRGRREAVCKPALLPQASPPKVRTIVAPQETATGLVRAPSPSPAELARGRLPPSGSEACWIAPLFLFGQARRSAPEADALGTIPGSPKPRLPDAGRILLPEGNRQRQAPSGIPASGGPRSGLARPGAPRPGRALPKIIAPRWARHADYPASLRADIMREGWTGYDPLA